MRTKISIVFTFLINLTIIGQNEIGLKVGLGYVNIYDKTKHSEYLLSDDTLGFEYSQDLGRCINFGVLYNRPFNNKISLLTGLNYMFKLHGFRMVSESEYIHSEHDLTLNYINSPILVRFQTMDKYLKYYFHGGLYISGLINASFSQVTYYGRFPGSVSIDSGGGKLDKSVINHLDVGISIGGGIKLVKVGPGSMFFEFNLDKGIPEILKYDKKGLTHNFDLYFSAGYLIYLNRTSEKNAT